MIRLAHNENKRLGSGCCWYVHAESSFALRGGEEVPKFELLFFAGERAVAKISDERDDVRSACEYWTEQILDARHAAFSGAHAELKWITMRRGSRVTVLMLDSVTHFEVDEE